MSITDYMQELGANARHASREMSAATTAQKNAALSHTADQIESERQAIISANQIDLEQSKTDGLSDALLDRLLLDDARISGMIEGLNQVISLPDPVGEISAISSRPSGIRVGKMRVPLGVIGIIYESRPNVTVDAASLCLKSGNAALLRGGREALNSNQTIASCISKGLEKAGLNPDAISVVNTIDREAVGEMIRMDKYIDVIVPRGGKRLIERVAKEATVPVIKHLEGNCHVYVDADADLEMAVSIAENAKCRRYGICGAMESLLVHSDIACEFLLKMLPVFQSHGVEVRGCEQVIRGLQSSDVDVSGILIASEQDWSEEYLAAIVSIKVVGSLDEAIQHINTYGSGHTDAIITDSHSKASKFLAQVDSSSVMINASTQFADGFEYGLGAEIGISTNKIHARGPVGLEGLTSQKWVVYGEGCIRS